MLSVQGWGDQYHDQSVVIIPRCATEPDVCIHRWGWQITLHPDGTTEARGPRGQILRSHAPPTLRAG